MTHHHFYKVLLLTQAHHEIMWEGIIQGLKYRRWRSLGLSWRLATSLLKCFCTLYLRLCWKADSLKMLSVSFFMILYDLKDLFLNEKFWMCGHLASHGQPCCLYQEQGECQELFYKSIQLSTADVMNLLQNPSVLGCDSPMNLVSWST